MPVVDPHIPTLCLVGSPNVGKSSLVRILSTGKPEVSISLNFEDVFYYGQNATDYF